MVVDIHDPSGDGGNMESVGTGYGIPYRSILVKGLNNLLVAGRCISVDAVGHGSTRNTPACALTGQAAGTAAALAVAERTTVRELPVSKVQERLTGIGVVPGTSSSDRAAYMNE